MSIEYAVEWGQFLHLMSAITYINTILKTHNNGSGIYGTLSEPLGRAYGTPVFCAFVAVTILRI